MFFMVSGVNTPFKKWENKLQDKLKKVTELEDHYNYKLISCKLASNGSVLISQNEVKRNL